MNTVKLEDLTTKGQTFVREYFSAEYGEQFEELFNCEAGRDLMSWELRQHFLLEDAKNLKVQTPKISFTNKDCTECLTIFSDESFCRGNDNSDAIWENVRDFLTATGEMFETAEQFAGNKHWFEFKRYCQAQGF